MPFGHLLKEHEAAFLLVPRVDGSGEDVVVPAVHLELIMGDGSGYFRVGFQILELGDDVGADERGVERRDVRVGDARRKVIPGGLDVAEPFGGQREAGQVAADAGVVRVGRKDSFDGAAVGVAANDNVTDVEDFDGVLDGGGDAAGHGAVGRDDVANDAAEEHVAGLGLEDEVGHDAGVGAGDEQNVRVLAVGEEMEAVFMGGEGLGAEFSIAGEETLHFVSVQLTADGG